MLHRSLWWVVVRRAGGSGQDPRDPPRGGQLRLAGLAVRADPTFAIVVALVAVSFWLRFGLRFDQAAAGGLAVAATVLFFGSLLAHELAHATEARHRGLEVAEIRLGPLGGATRITSEIGRARDELALAVVGPWTSISLGCGFGLLAWGADRSGLAAAGELAGVLGWLNALLGVFNLLPAAPLDGGRVLDAVVWWVTGSRAAANRVATGAGLVLGSFLVALGVLVALEVAGGVVEGLWLVLLGSVLVRSASGERRAFELKTRLEGHVVGELVVPRLRVRPEVTVEEAITSCQAAGEHEVVLVADTGGVVGVLLVAVMAGVRPEERWLRRVGTLMTPIDALASVEAEAPAQDLLALVGDGPVAVQMGGEVRDVVTEGRLVDWLDRLLAGEPGGTVRPQREPARPSTPTQLPSAPGPLAPGRGVLWQRRLVRSGLVAVSGAVVVAGLGFVPLPLVELAPGPALDVPSLLAIDAVTHPLRGKLLLTSVELGAPSALGAARAIVDPDRELLWRSSVVPAGVDPSDYLASQLQVFRDSVRLAAAVGLRAAGYAVGIEGGGAVVRAVASGGPADGVLTPGDVVTAVGQVPVASAADLVAQVSRRFVGETVALEVRRGDRRIRVEVPALGVDVLGRPALGVSLEDAAPLVTLPFTVEVRRSDLGGPSAGLMTALSVYALVSGVDVANGRVVAGTGTIDAEGGVGAVGGIPEKVRGAERAGASIFLVPATDAAAARHAAEPGLRVVGVTSFSGALAALRRAGRSADPPPRPGRPSGPGR